MATDTANSVFLFGNQVSEGDFALPSGQMFC